MISIREKVARALLSRRSKSDYREIIDGSWGIDHDLELARCAITAFLEAAAEDGWQMCRSEATEEMLSAATGHIVGTDNQELQKQDDANTYRAMLSVPSAQFKWDGA